MRAAFFLLVLIATLNFAHASAGPPPFKNQSPLQSGTDGSYQAIASGRNLTGVFSFVIRNGIQTSDQNPIINGWVFFVDGNIFQGSVVAAISQSKVAGVLNGGVSTLPFETGDALTLPSAFVVPGNTASGDFRGEISLNSPEGKFSGEGTLQGTPERVDQAIVLNTATTTNLTTNFSPDNPGVPISVESVVVVNSNISQVSRIVIPATGIPETEFDFHGTRVSTIPATAPTPSPTASPTPSPTPTTGGTTTPTTGGTATTTSG